MLKASYAGVLYAAPEIDDVAGIIKDVAVMTMGDVPDRGTVVDAQTLVMLKACCDKYASGVKVKADHKSGIFGTTAYLKNFRIEGDKLKADMYVLDSDPNRAKLLEMAREIPDTFGLSVSIEQELENTGSTLAIRPTAVDSVDLVTEPAANPAGLFSKQVDANPKNKTTMTDAEMATIKETCSQLMSRFDEFSKKVEEKMKKYDAEIWPDVPAANTGGEKPAPHTGLFAKQFAEFKADTTKTMADFEKNIVTKVAAEFSKVIGQSVVKVGADSAEADKKAAETAAATAPDAFEARVQKFYASTKSKTEAMSKAIAEDNKETGGKGYAAFIAAAKSVKYSKD